MGLDCNAIAKFKNGEYVCFSLDSFYLEIEEYDTRHRILRDCLGISTKDRHPVTLEKLDTE